MADVLTMTPGDLQALTEAAPVHDIGEATSPSWAILISGGAASLIPGKSSDLCERGFKPFPEMHLSTQHALALTNALAVFHAHTKAGVLNLRQEGDELNRLRNYDIDDVISAASDLSLNPEIDPWTSNVARPPLVSANLSILTSALRQSSIQDRIVDRLDAIQTDVETLTQFLHFASMMQNDVKLPSVGPICMSDVWVSKNSSLETDSYDIIIRLRGGRTLQSPPLRDCAWMWLTLLHPDVLRERYEELNEAYCHAFNGCISRIHAVKEVPAITSFDLTRDLGENLLHAFLTVAHKFTLGGVWPLDRQLHTDAGITALGEAMGFLVDQGIVGSLFIA